MAIWGFWYGNQGKEEERRGQVLGGLLEKSVHKAHTIQELSRREGGERLQHRCLVPAQARQGVIQTGSSGLRYPAHPLPRVGPQIPCREAHGEEH